VGSRVLNAAGEDGTVNARDVRSRGLGRWVGFGDLSHDPHPNSRFLISSLPGARWRDLSVVTYPPLQAHARSRRPLRRGVR
jgi:hypothetical protein